MARIGDIIEGKYEILTQIGRGGMSRVYLAMDRRLNKQWAIKEIQRSGTDPRLKEAVANSALVEANMIKQFDHYHIPHINDIIEHEDYIYVVMDYVEGESLSRIIHDEGPQDEKLVIKWGMQLTDTLHYLHTRIPPIVYRDMKPSNVMIKPDGDVKLIDFGIAREYKERNLADTTVLGTVGYAPPEQFGGAQTDERADIYALGATLYHAVTGIGPQKGEAFIIRPIRSINPELSGGLEKIILKCTKPDPEDRYANCTELMYDLSHYREIDDAFLEKQKGKLRRFALRGVLFVLLLVVGFTCMGISMLTTTQNYEQNMNWARSSNDAGVRADYYQRAIRIKPLEQEPYLEMIRAFKEDAVFTLEEEQLLLKTFNPNLSQLREQEFYGDVAFEIGKLYWYYYAYGGAGGAAVDSANQSTRMKSAVPWFADVLEYGGEFHRSYSVAHVYHNIGRFHEDITVNVTEASDKGMYRSYWDSLGELVAATGGDKGEPELVRLTLDSLVLDAISSYARKFKGDGVSESEMRALYDSVVADVQSVEPTADVTTGMKESILSISTQLSNEAIVNAFRSDNDPRGLR